MENSRISIIIWIRFTKTGSFIEFYERKLSPNERDPFCLNKTPTVAIAMVDGRQYS